MASKIKNNTYYLLSKSAEDKFETHKRKLYKFINPKNKNFKLIIFIFILMYFSSCLSKEIKFKKLILFSEISLTIKGKGEQNILSEEREEKSNICKNIIINGNQNNCTEEMIYNLEEEINNITIIWNNEFTSCNKLFYKLSNITYINLSRFNSSLVNNSISMFDSCTSLTSIDLNNFNTSSITDMGNMFSHCSSLLELDLSEFDTSKTTSFGEMFGFCSSIKSLNLSNFDLSQSTYIHNMFKDCSSLISIEIKNFYSDKLISVRELFSGCSSLISLDLSSFYLGSIYLWKIRVNDILTDCNPNIRLCYEDTLFENITDSDIRNSITSQFSEFINNNNCSDLCFTNTHNKFILEENKCIDECFHDNNYKYEFNNICYNSCPNGTRNSFNNIYLCEEGLICNIYSYNHLECLENIPLGFYLNDTFLKTIDKCINKCSNCSNESLSYDLCISCNNEQNYFAKYNDSSNKYPFINCYNEIEEGFYLDKINEIYKQCYYKCKSCNDSGSEESNNCLKCYSNYTLENGNCYESFSSNSIEEENTEQSFSTNILGKENADQKCIYYYSDECLYIDKGKNNFQILIKQDDTYVYIYKIDSNITKLKAKYINLTFIDFSSEAIEFIKSQFNLEEEGKIYVIINDSLSNDSNTATSNYNYKLVLENGSELNISNLNNDFYVDIYVPIRDLGLAHFDYYILFSEQGYDIYDKKSSFYNDLCTPAYIGENDIVRKDRKKYIYPNNVTMCKSNCYYKDVNTEKKRITCNCNLNLNNNIYNENSFLEEKEEADFLTYLLSNINYKIFKCYKVLSSFENLKDNYFFYIAIGYVFINLILCFLFYYKEISVIKLIFANNIPKEKKVFIETKNELKKQREKNFIINKSKRHISIFKKKGIKYLRKNKWYSSSINTNSNFFLKDNKNLIDIIDKNESLGDINELPYSRAIYYDNRNLILIFNSIILQKFELINIFIGDDKLKVLLLCQYILSHLINLFFNTLLYTDDVISNKYENNGDLDIFISLILSILSNIITSIIRYFLECTKSSEVLIEEILLLKKKTIYIERLIQLIKILKIKSCIFFLSEIIIINFTFYYIIIFSIIYSKSKLSAFINYLYSLIEGLIISIVIAIIVTITRKMSLIYKIRYLYNTSKFINDKF